MDKNFRLLRYRLQTTDFYSVEGIILKKNSLISKFHYPKTIGLMHIELYVVNWK